MKQNIQFIVLLIMVPFVFTGCGSNEKEDGFFSETHESIDVNADNILDTNESVIIPDENNSTSDEVDNEVNTDNNDTEDDPEPLVANVALNASSFDMILDVNESTIVSNWHTLSTAIDANDSFTAIVKTQGNDGVFTITEKLITYVKTTEGNETDTAVIEISDGLKHTQITVSLYPLYWKQVSAGVLHTVAIKSDGTLWAWGNNDNGELGDGTTTSRNIPTQESSSSTNWSFVSAESYRTAAIKSDGTLWAWGKNDKGQVGDGTTMTRNTPTQESSASINWTSVTAGVLHTVAIKSDGTLWAWGDNDKGQLGNETTTLQIEPTQESSGSTHWRSVSTGYEHTIALKNDGTLWAWGDNSHSQLGDGTTTNRNIPTQESSASSDWNIISGGAVHNIALKNDGTLWIWGDNFLGTFGTRLNTPTQESSASTNWRNISAGYEHTVVIKNDNTLWGWGGNKHAQLGDGTMNSRDTPTQESSAAINWSSVSTGAMHTVAIKSDGTLWIWGTLVNGVDVSLYMIPTVLMSRNL